MDASCCMFLFVENSPIVLKLVMKTDFSGTFRYDFFSRNGQDKTYYTRHWHTFVQERLFWAFLKGGLRVTVVLMYTGTGKSQLFARWNFGSSGCSHLIFWIKLIVPILFLEKDRGIRVQIQKLVMIMMLMLHSGVQLSSPISNLCNSWVASTGFQKVGINSI